MNKENLKEFDLVEEYENNSKKLYELKEKEKKFKEYSSKIKYNGKKRLLKIEVMGNYYRGLKYQVSISKFSNFFDRAYTSKSFDNFKDTFDLFSELKEKYNGKDLLISLKVKDIMIAIGKGIIFGTFSAGLMILAFSI